MDSAVVKVVDQLKTVSKDVTTSEEISQVGIISANGEKEIGDMIARAMNKVGKNGLIAVEEAKTLETELEVVEGMLFDRGYLSPWFSTSDKMVAELEDPLILIYNDKKTLTNRVTIGFLEENIPTLIAELEKNTGIIKVFDKDGNLLLSGNDLIIDDLRKQGRAVHFGLPVKSFLADQIRFSLCQS